MITRGIRDENMFLLALSDISHPADQSIDRLPCRSNAGIVFPVRSLDRTSEGSPIPKRGRAKLASRLAEILHYPRVPKESKINRHDLYVVMSAASHLKPPPPFGSRASVTDVIYENCSKCSGARCRPPPRGTPAKVRHHSRIFNVQSFLTGLQLKKSAEEKSSAHEALQADGPNAEMNGQRLTSEGKRLLFLCVLEAPPPLFSHLQPNHKFLSWTFSLSYSAFSFTFLLLWICLQGLLGASSVPCVYIPILKLITTYSLIWSYNIESDISTLQTASVQYRYNNIRLIPYLAYFCCCC